jgi:uncharacterized membrane protein
LALDHRGRSELREAWRGARHLVGLSFRWQIRTFWLGLLWVSLCVLFVIATFGIGILIVWLPIGLAGLWFIYRIGRGWMALRDRRPMYM